MKHTKSMRNLLFSSLTIAFTAACTPTTQNNNITTPAPAPQSISSINFYGTITESSANNFITRFNQAAQSSPNIRVNIRSVGGISIGARNMKQAIENSGRNVYMSCEGLVASAGSTLLITTESRNRNAEANCQIMIHSPLYRMPSSNGSTVRIEYPEMAEAANNYKNHAPDTSVTITTGRNARVTLLNSYLQSLFNTLKSDRQDLVRELAEHSKFNTADINALFNSGDFYFSLSEAAFVGFVDTVQGIAPSASYLAEGKQRFCTRAPQLSVCR